MRILAIAAISLALLSGCARNSEAADREKVMTAIQDTEEAQAAAFRRNDLDKVFAIYAEDSMLYLPGLPPAHGREAIRAVDEHAMKDPAFNVTIDEASRKWWVARSGDLATTTYTTIWTHTDAASGKPMTEQMMSQTTWVRQPDQSWKNVMDINAVYPASATPAG
jgi:uncharacterized protein (TIGR02246 family)